MAAADPGPSLSLLLTQLGKRVFRRSDEELLGVHLRLLMALSFVRDHDGGPGGWLTRCAWTPTTSCWCAGPSRRGLGYVTRSTTEDRRRHLVDLTASGRRALAAAETAQESIEADVLRASIRPSVRSCTSLLARALREAEPVELTAPSGT